jgi:hypothetical protein
MLSIYHRPSNDFNLIPASVVDQVADQPSSDCMGCIFWSLHDEHETRTMNRLMPCDLNELSSLFVMITGLPQ